MNALKFVMMRLGKDSVSDILALDQRPPGKQDPAYELTITCKQVPDTLEAGTFAILWLGSDNSKGGKTAWKQGIRAIAIIKDVEHGGEYNDDSNITVSIGYIFAESINKFDLIDVEDCPYRRFSELPIVGLNDYANQTVREIDDGPRSKIGILIAECGKVSESPLDDLLAIYPQLKSLSVDGFGSPGDIAKALSHHNWVFFGAPGTGKSHRLDKLAKAAFRENIRRVTFYPDYAYSQFVGCYKPVTRFDENKDDEPLCQSKGYISYEFVPGPFLETYIEAVKNPEKNYVLIVEEINRANAAAVFGDVFQLLDRDADGRSKYEIAVPEEMKVRLECDFFQEKCNGRSCGHFGEVSPLKKECERLSLPPNMYIWATMNSADQGVFPMDTAFKRRWDFRYMGIDEGESADIDGTPLNKIEVLCGGRTVAWNNLRHAINEFMASDALKINEDKLLGPFFINPSALTSERFADVFKDKVLLYLYEDAGKTKRKIMFKKELNTYAKVCAAFDKDGVDIFGNGFDSNIVFGETEGADDAASEG